jgi:hypothetical protein
MSLAMTAAPFDSDNTQNYGNYSNYSSDTPVNKKRQNHNKTQKRMPSADFNPEKVNSVIESIHNQLPDSDNSMNLGDFNPKKNNAPALQEFKPLNPLQPPESMRMKEGMTNNTSSNIPQPMQNEDMDLQNLQSAFMNDKEVNDYYNKLVPNLNHNKYKNKFNKNYYPETKFDNSFNANDGNDSSNNNNNQVLLDKLNYMINLLEEQQDEKTNNVTEEVVLYSFLGIFMIFIVDSFARVGKYVR